MRGTPVRLQLVVDNSFAGLNCRIVGDGEENRSAETISTNGLR